VGIIGEDSPFIASYIIGFILMLAHLLYQNNFNIYLKGLFFIIFVSILIAIISIDSRTQILFSIFYFVFYFFFSMKFLNKNFLFFLLICLIIFIILFPQFQFKGQDFDFRFFELNLFETKLHDANARYGNWLMHLNDYFLFCKSFPLLFITGLGFGGNYIIYNTISSASDNNYLSFFYQTGLFGIIAIYALIILYLLKIFKNISIHNYDIFCKFLSFFIASLLISFNTHELLFVGKSNFLFLILISIYNLLIYRINKNE